MQTLWHVPLVSVLNGFHSSCSQTRWQVISIENQTDLIIRLVLVDDSGSKALRSLRTVFDIDRLVERLTFCQFMASTTASTRSLQIVKPFTIGCKQIPRNRQKPRTGQSPKTPILCSYLLPTLSRVQLQTVHSFVLNRHYFSFLLDEWWYPVSS